MDFCPSDTFRNFTVNLDSVGVSTLADLRVFLRGNDFGEDTCGNKLVPPFAPPIMLKSFNVFTREAEYTLDISQLNREEGGYDIWVMVRNELENPSCAFRYFSGKSLRFRNFNDQAVLDIQGICAEQPLLFSGATEAGNLANVTDPEFRFELLVQDLAGDIVFDAQDICAGSGCQNGFQSEWVNPPAGQFVSIFTIIDDRDLQSKACIQDFRDTFSVKPVIWPTESDAYFESFEDSAGALSPAADGDRYSWEWGTPGPFSIWEAAHGSQIWATNLNGLYLPNEHSYLYLVCQDIQALDAPMISMQLFSHTPANVDGAFFEISTDNGATWQRLGRINDGLPTGVNWYDTENVIAVPPISATDIRSQGWSGLADDWQTISHDLDFYMDSIRPLAMRIGFASIQPNPTQEGFALDSIWVGERRRKPLIESVVNAPISTDRNTWRIRNAGIYEVMNENQAGTSFLQYHTPFPNSDPVFEINPNPPAALTLAYGLSRSDVILIDGTPFEGAPAELAGFIRLRGLVPPLFLIRDVEFMPTTNPNSVAFTLEAQIDIPEKEMTVSLALVDPDFQTGPESPYGMGQFQSLLADMLPDAGGRYLRRAWNRGDSLRMVMEKTRDFPNFDYGSVDIAIWVKDLHAGEVHQSFAGPSPFVIEERPQRIGQGNENVSAFIQVYPNPVRDFLNIDIQSEIEGGLQIWLSDLQGRKVLAFDFLGEQGVRKIPLGSLPAGMFMLYLKTHDLPPVTQKIIRLSP